MAPKSKRQKTTQSSFSVEESDWEKFASALLGSKYGHIYCEQLGISLAPGDSDSLYQWLCCSILMSSGLSEKLTTRAGKVLLESGLLKDPATCKQSAHNKFVGYLDHKFQRKEQTAKYMHSSAEVLLDKYEGNLFKLREAAKEKPEAERKKLQEIKGLAKVGIDIFFREAQTVWPELVPFVDGRASTAAKKLGLPSSASELYRLVGEDVNKLARLAAALVRLDLAKAKGSEDARKLLAGEAVEADEDEEDAAAQEMKDKAGDKPQGAADVKADQGAGKADSKPAADAEADGKGSKAEAAQESLKSGGQGGETKAAEAQPDKAGAEGDKGAAEMDVEHKAKPEAAGETGDV